MGKKLMINWKVEQVLPNGGYVKGNVAIMSFRANRLKNNGTAEEHRKIADFIEEHNKWSS